jgi:hypothetical protein
MSKSNAWETALLQNLFQNATVAAVGDATGLRGSTTAGSLFVSLHTSSPGEAGTQSTNETSYTSYARIGVARSGSGWVVTGNSVSPAAAVTFAECTGGTATITHFGIGTLSSGTGTLLYYGTVSPNISVSTGVTPRLTTSTAITEE